MTKILKLKAIAYLRTSSSTNVGSDKGSESRQREAIAEYAAAHGIELVASYYDAAVSGKDPLETRKGFSALLDHIEGNGVRTVLIEDASRLARDLAVQEAGIAKLQELEVTVLTSRGEDLTQTDDEMRVMMRQVAGAFSQLEKTRLVKKLKDGRERKKAAPDGRKDAKGKGKCGGRDTVVQRYPKAVAMAKKLARVRKNKPSLREISAALAAAGLVSVTMTKDGVPLPEPIKRPFTAEVVKRMLASRLPQSAAQATA